VIGGGGTVLAAPLLLRPFPDSFVNGRGALVTFSGLSLLMTALGCFLLLPSSISLITALAAVILIRDLGTR